MVDPDTFRALARSSPWLWSSVAFTRTTVTRDGAERLRAWIKRPARMRVEPEHGDVHVVDERDQLGRNRGVFRAVSTDDHESIPQRRVPQPVYRVPQDPGSPQPVRREDGLVISRPDDVELVYDDPMYVNYQWVAMLDPQELADGALDGWAPDGDVPDGAGVPGDVPAQDGACPPGVEVLELERGELFGRAVLRAVVRPSPDYDPRCACCPLLHSEVSVAIDRAEGAPPLDPMPVFADRFETVLDVATGIVVRLRDIGGDRDGEGFDVEIDEVDADYPDAMFQADRRATRRRGILRRRSSGEAGPSPYPPTPGISPRRWRGPGASSP
ncbi:hypothetical protein EF847_18985 [Actinobacteria bacterium YIM 96077]|uniref:Uncharacterized protein n=1 Tax=Phytoactinopolyspora halophila TaxID=1981511 RepID=A0A329QID7_9ACTN|nr:hypothetical protein [Phytoactinopolyspora halophila]AYY14466.1 hypothetical protein EF847_18985 [Actinobacteria bacterium YIM 96077]RAW11459.1 hypothetical protein DPM12_16635 [Phytoactinopolyspora halophila]